MEQTIIKEQETMNTKVSLIKNTIKNESDYSVVIFSKKCNIETSRWVFDTLRQATNKYNKEIQ